MDNVVHFEIPADDMARAQKFYHEAFGWKIEAMPEMGYAILITTPTDEQKRRPVEPGAINGGMLKRQSPITAPVITINVKDVDAAVEKLGKAGGKVIRAKMPVGDMGYAAYFKDTEGNVIGLWQSTGHLTE